MTIRSGVRTARIILAVALSQSHHRSELSTAAAEARNEKDYARADRAGSPTIFAFSSAPSQR